MFFNNKDCFSLLFISQNTRVYEETIKDKYRFIKQQEETKKQQIYDESRRRKSAINKVEHLNELDNKKSKIDRAYEYCISPKNRVLRNAIVDLNAGKPTKIFNVIERDNSGTTGFLTLRPTKRDMECLDMPNLKIVELRKYDLVDGINKLNLPLKEYKIMLSSIEGDFDYDFYTEGIDILRLQNDMLYRQVLLKAIEINNMENHQEKERSKYIGMIEENEDGDYVISKSRRIEDAVRLKQINMIKNSNDISGHKFPEER